MSTAEQAAVIGALVGGGAAIVAQLIAQTISHMFARRRETAAQVRHLTAQVLGRARLIHYTVTKAANTGTELDVDQLAGGVAEFAAAHYELRFAAPTALRARVERFVTLCDQLIKAVALRDLEAQLHADALVLVKVQDIEDSLVDVANDLDDAVACWLHPIPSRGRRRIKNG